MSKVFLVLFSFFFSFSFSPQEPHTPYSSSSVSKTTVAFGVFSFFKRGGDKAPFFPRAARKKNKAPHGRVLTEHGRESAAAAGEEKSRGACSRARGCGAKKVFSHCSTVLSAAAAASSPARSAPSMYPGHLVLTSVPAQNTRPTGLRN
jgi:hypothetical protein